MPRTDSSLANSALHLKKNEHQSSNSSKTEGRRGYFRTHPMRLSVTLTLKMGKDIIKKLQTNMNINAKILSAILTK